MMSRNSQHLFDENISRKANLIPSDRVTDLVDKGNSSNETV